MLYIYCLQEAVESFKKALAVLCPVESHPVTAPEAAQIYHLMGMCYMSQDLLQQVLIAEVS